MASVPREFIASQRAYASTMLAGGCTWTEVVELLMSEFGIARPTAKKRIREVRWIEGASRIPLQRGGG